MWIKQKSLSIPTNKKARTDKVDVQRAVNAVNTEKAKDAVDLKAKSAFKY